MSRKLIVTIEHDPDVECPSENGDGQWQAYSFNSRHIRFKHPDEFDNPSIRRKLKSGLAFMLQYYEHGLCRWDLSGQGPQCPWDSVQTAGILVWEEPASHMGAKTYEDRQKDAQGFLEEYNAWCNGETYYFSIEDQDGDEIDSCGGFYGPEHLFAGIAENVKPDDEVKYAGQGSYLANYYAKT